jgi:hypothetical protein
MIAMGSLQIETTVGNTNRGAMERVAAIVDPQATYSMFPASLLTQLRVEVWEHNHWFDIDGTEAHYDFGVAHLELDGRQLPCSVIFGPEGRYVIGATTLQTFGLVLAADCDRLVPR